MERESLELAEIEAHLRSRRHARRWVIGLMLFLLAVAVALIASFYLLARPALRTAAGFHSFYYGLGASLSMYARDHDGLYPPLSEEPGRLMYPASAIYPRYWGDLSAWTYPGDERPAGDSPHDLIDDQSYWYLGYAVTSDAEAEALAEAYLERLAKGLGFEEDLPVPPGRGTAGGGVLYRLREGIKDDIPGGLSIPVMIQRPAEGRSRCLVLFLDGRRESLPCPGAFPLSPATIGALRRMDAAGKR